MGEQKQRRTTRRVQIIYSMFIPPELLIAAYSQGVFPMADEKDRILWFDPDPRAILPLDEFHISRSLWKTIRQKRFVIRFDSDFSSVIRACALPAPGRELTWINDDIVESYEALHKIGTAHSVEAWHAGELAGGLYGVAINGLFAGESMFSIKSDASKVALYYLVQHLIQQGFLLLDVQFLTDHLERLGAIEITREEYKSRLVQALATPVIFG